MPHETRESPEPPVSLVARESALLRVVVAMSMLDENEATALMSMSNEELGHTLKSGIAQTAPMARRIRLDLRKKKYAQSKEAVQSDLPGAIAKRNARSDAAAWNEVVNQDKIFKGRQALVRSKKLLPAAAIWERLGVTKQALSKAVASGRIFTVDVGAATY